MKNTKGFTALHGAAYHGRQAVVAALLAKVDIDVNAKNTEGFTALHDAACNGHQAVVAALLAKEDIDINIKDTLRKKTALDFAAMAGHPNIVDAIQRKIISQTKHEVDSLCDKFADLGVKSSNEEGDVPALATQFEQVTLSYEHISEEVKSELLNRGLEYVSMPDDNSCLYHAVDKYLGKDAPTLRKEVADYISANIEEYRTFICSELSNTTPEEYIKRIKGEEWAGEIEISALMKIYGRPIKIVGPDGKVRNKSSLEGKGESIYVYYNGKTHYDALIKTTSFVYELDNDLIDDSGRTLIFDGPGRNDQRSDMDPRDLSLCRNPLKKSHG